MAGSLLNAVGLPELVTYSIKGTHPFFQFDEQRPLTRRMDPRLRGDDTTMTHPLFDTDRFRRHLEAAYVTMWERVQRGEPPEGFAVQAVA